MKRVQLPIAPFEEKHLFMPIRDSVAYARVVLNTTRILLLNMDTVHDAKSSLALVVDKMNRFFYFKDSKYFSIASPFSFEIVEGGIKNIYTRSGIEINSQIISEGMNIISNQQFALSPVCSHFIFEGEYVSMEGVHMLEEILAFEPAYIRYDHDPILEDDIRHPLDHLDINFNQSTTFKLGLSESISTGVFEDITNTKTNCPFLSFPNDMMT